MQPGKRSLLASGLSANNPVVATARTTFTGLVKRRAPPRYISFEEIVSSSR